MGLQPHETSRRRIGLQARVLYAVSVIPAPQELRTYFVTTVTASRRRLFQVETNARLLANVLQSYREQNRFALHAFVIMPDHLHILLTPAQDVSLEKAMQFIKGGFSFRFKSRLGVWERGYNEAQIRTLEKFAACRIYIEKNPVRARLSDSPGGYAFSSASWLRAMDPVPSHFVQLR